MSEKKTKCIVIPDGQYYNYIKIKDLLRIEADGRYAHIYTINNEKYTSVKPLGDYAYLQDDFTFFRAHRSHLINLKYVKTLVTSSGGYIIMEDDSQVSISRNLKNEFLKAMEKLDFD